jgi:hypothetical protein
MGYAINGMYVFEVGRILVPSCYNGMCNMEDSQKVRKARENTTCVRSESKPDVSRDYKIRYEFA